MQRPWGRWQFGKMKAHTEPVCQGQKRWCQVIVRNKGASMLLLKLQVTESPFCTLWKSCTLLICLEKHPVNWKEFPPFPSLDGVLAPVFLNITWHHLFCPRHTGSVWALIFPNCHPPQDLCTVYSCCLENPCSLLVSRLVFFEVPVSVLPVGSLDKKNNLYQLSTFNVICLFYNMCPIGYVVLLYLFDHILWLWLVSRDSCFSAACTLNISWNMV